MSMLDDHDSNMNNKTESAIAETQGERHAPYGVVTALCRVDSFPAMREARASLERRARPRSETPPHTPWLIRWRWANCKQGSLTTHCAQMRCATGTPVPSFGKNTEESMLRHLASLIQSVLTKPPDPRLLSAYLSTMRNPKTPAIRA